MPLPLTDLAVLIVLFVVAWAGVCWLLAGAGGWRDLARHYAQGDRPFTGETRRFRHLSLGWLANYGNTLSAGRGPEGIRLALARLILVGHPPLLIPWAEVPSPIVRGLGPMRVAEFRFPRAPAVRVRVRASLAAWLLEARPGTGAAAGGKKALDTVGRNP